MEDFLFLNTGSIGNFYKCKNDLLELLTLILNLTEKYFLLAFIGLTKKLMSLRHLVLAGTLALSSCATDTSEAPQKKNR